MMNKFNELTKNWSDERKDRVEAKLQQLLQDYSLSNPQHSDNVMI